MTLDRGWKNLVNGNKSEILVYFCIDISTHMFPFSFTGSESHDPNVILVTNLFDHTEFLLVCLAIVFILLY